MINRIIIFIFALSATASAQPSTNYSGDVHLYNMVRMNDLSIINLPFRIFNLSIDHQNGDYNINSTLAMEYRFRDDTSFLIDTSPKDFTLDLRELYITRYTSFGEIRVGKQIHAWGSADENSPSDNLNAIDYYYLFFGGGDRKIGSMSFATDVYMDSWKFGIFYAPTHPMNRLPLNDPEFPFQLPVTPRKKQVLSPENQNEYGISIQKSFNFGDITGSYFRGNDRMYSLSGSNVFTNSFQTVTVLDTVFAFRETEVFSLGLVIPTSLFTLRAEASYFDTKDNNDTTSIKHDHHEFPTVYTDIMFTHAFEVKAEYYETVLQLETELPFDIRFNSMFIKYDTVSYSANALPDVELPLLTAEFDPSAVFFPGMGTPIVSLAKQAGIVTMEKNFLDDQLTMSFMGLLDFTDYNGTKGNGMILEGSASYELMESMDLKLSAAKFQGNSKLGETYPFNNMEDFSHFRIELQYFY